MDSSWTVTDVVARMVDAGLVDAAAAAEMDADTLEKSLDYYGEPEHVAVLRILDEFGVRYRTDYKTFRGACEREGVGYRQELEEIGQCGRGLLAITDIEVLDTVEAAHLIRFRCNGRSHEWKIRHTEEDEDFYAQMCLFESLGDLVPIDAPQRWCSVEPEDPDASFDAVFGDPEALQRLGAEFGMTFEPLAADKVPDRPKPRIDDWLATQEAGFSAWVATYSPEVLWDFSRDSLDTLEEVTRRAVSSAEELMAAEYRGFRDGASWYLGEVLRRNLGGYWDNDHEGDEVVRQVGARSQLMFPFLDLKHVFDQPGYLGRHYDYCAVNE